MSPRLVLWSDFVCPFCYIAETSSVDRLLREYELTLDWRGFELHPDTPPGGRRLAEMFGEERSKAMGAQLLRFAASFGVTRMKFQERSPNTRKALAMAEHARDEGHLHPFRRAAMDAHWLKGEDLEADDVLARCAETAGLDPKRALDAMATPALKERVDAMGRDAARAGVRGIPTFLIGEAQVVGCQPYEVLEVAAVKAGARRLS